MPDSTPPTAARQVTDAFLTAVDDAAPGLIEGLYLVGSVALGDFHPHTSDVDFVAVTAARPDADGLAALAAAHVAVRRRYPRPHFDGVHLTWADLATGPAGCPDVPCAQLGRFQPAGRSALDPVTWSELAGHGVAVRGPAPSTVDIAASGAALRAYTVDNLTSYWRPWWSRHRRLGPRLPITLTSWFTAWGVLGVSRLHHLLATGELTSKSGAGRYAREAFDPRWHRIVAEALRIRAGQQSRSRYRTPLGRRRDALDFVAMATEAALALG